MPMLPYWPPGLTQANLDENPFDISVKIQLDTSKKNHEQWTKRDTTPRGSLTLKVFVFKVYLTIT